ANGFCAFLPVIKPVFVAVAKPGNFPCGKEIVNECTSGTPAVRREQQASIGLRKRCAESLFECVDLFRGSRWKAEPARRNNLRRQQGSVIAVGEDLATKTLQERAPSTRCHWHLCMSWESSTISQSWLADSAATVSHIILRQSASLQADARHLF